MKTKLKFTLLLAAVALIAAPFVSAQVTLNNFSNFGTADTAFVGDWDGGGNAPRSTFVQNIGSYSFIGGANDDNSGAYYFFPSSPGNLTGLTLLQLSARTLAGNAASTFSITLFSGGGDPGATATATFATAAFVGGAGFTTVSTAYTATASFDPTAVDSFLITGGINNGHSLLNIAFDNLAVAAPRALVPVPEASTYGLCGGALLGLIVIARRRRAVTRANAL